MDQESEKQEDSFLPDFREGRLSGVFPCLYPYLLAGWSSYLLYSSLIFYRKCFGHILSMLCSGGGSLIFIFLCFVYVLRGIIYVY